MNLQFLNAKDLKPIRAMLEKQYGITEKLPYVFLLSEKDDLYVVSEEVKDIDLEHLRTHTIGIYVGEIKKGRLRPSIEGSALFGPLAKKNVFHIDKKVEKMWMYGLDIPCSDDTVEGFVLIKSENDWCGSGWKKDDKVLNHVPKGRRIHE